jgi:chromosome segregation ATPase
MKKQTKSLEELKLELEETEKKKTELQQTLGIKEEVQAQVESLSQKLYQLEDIDWTIEALQEKIESFKPANLDLRKEVGKACVEFRNKLLTLVSNAPGPHKKEENVDQVDHTLELFGIYVSEVDNKEFWKSSTHQCQGYSRISTDLDQEVWDYAFGKEK